MPPHRGAAAWLHVDSSPRESSPCWHEDSFPKELLFPEVRQVLKPLTENSFHWEREQCKHKEENKREAPPVRCSPISPQCTTEIMRGHFIPEKTSPL